MSLLLKWEVDVLRHHYGKIKTTEENHKVLLVVIIEYYIQYIIIQYI